MYVFCGVFIHNTCIHTCIQIYIYADRHMYTKSYCLYNSNNKVQNETSTDNSNNIVLNITDVSVHTYIPTCMHACMHACMHTYIYTYAHTLFAHMYIDKGG